MNKHDGFIEAGFLFIVGIISLLTLGALLYMSGMFSLVAATERDAKKYSETEDLLFAVETAMQRFVNDKADSIHSETLVNLEVQFAGTGIRITDVSSGINTMFWSETLLEKAPIRNLLLRENEAYTVEYGWISATFLPAVTFEKIKKSFDVTDTQSLFPLVNDLSLVNIHFLPPDLLSALLEAFAIPRAEEKAAILLNLIRDETLDEIKIAAILQIPQTHELFALLGIKTTFWRVSVVSGEYMGEGIFAGVPDKTGNPRTISSYELIERRIFRVGT